MDNTIFRDLISNAAILLLISIIYEIRYIVPAKLAKLIPYIDGILIGILCFGVMSMPFQIKPGLFFDTRTILIGVTAAMFGGMTTLIAVCATVAYRLALGGVGMWMGALTIVSSAALGLAWRKRLANGTPKGRWKSIYAFGLAVHIAMLAFTLLLPWPLAKQTLRQIALPVMLIYPIATLLLILLLKWQKERKDATRQVAEAEERYRNMFDESHAVMLIIDPDTGRIVDANPAACRFYGWTQDDMKRMDLSGISTLAPEIIREGLRQFVSGERKHFQVKHHKANGEIVDAEVYSGPVRFGGRKLLLSIVHDVTSRVASDMKLKESESRLRSAQAMAHVGNWEYDLKTRTYWASEEFFSIYGFAYDPADPYLPADAVRETVFDKDRPILGSDVWNALETSGKFDLEHRIVRASDGRTSHIHATGRIERGPDGRARKVIGFSQDITERKLAEIALSRSEAKNREMIANITDVIVIMEPDGIIRYNSANTEKWFGWTPDEIVGKNGWDIIHPDDRPRLMKQYAILLEIDQGTVTVQCRYLCKSGSYRIIELTAFNLLRDPIIEGILINFRDVTDRNQAQMEYKALLDATMDSFWIINGEGKFLDVNDAYSRLTGYSREELTGMSITDVEVCETPEMLKAHLKKILTGGQDRFETRHRCKNGIVVDVEISCNAVPGSDGRICAFLRDITDRKKHEDKVVYLSRHDTLTGLYNRAYFEEALKLEDDAGRLPMSVITGDINGLKLTNDIFGHADGDMLLQTIAAILTKCCRSTDIVARVGGDEFNILLPGTGAGPAQAICERIFRACEASQVSAGGRPIHPSISLGCATKAADGQPIAGILKSAEDSMYKRKLLERKSMHSSLISSIKATMLEKSHETKEHADRLISLCKEMGQNLNLSADQINDLELLAALHDIGKIGIDERILTSPRKLTQEEWQEMKKHPEIGYRIALASPELVSIANCVLYHHERWDGNGYPQKLKGSKIPLLARIVAVVDAYDAMTSDRPYRQAMSRDDAVRELQANAGRQFDPEIVRVFLETIG